MAEANWKETGSAYDRPEATFDDEIVQVERGTPTGELLRRYWHPIAVADEVGELPQSVRVLGATFTGFALHAHQIEYRAAEQQR